MVITQILYKIYLSRTLNGALAGWVAIIAGPDLTNHSTSMTIGAFVVVASLIVWLVLKVTVAIRIDEVTEASGSDTEECGMEAYPEFGHSSLIA